MSVPALDRESVSGELFSRFFFLFSRIFLRDFRPLFLVFSVGLRMLRMAGHSLGVSIYRNPEPYPDHRIITKGVRDSYLRNPNAHGRPFTYIRAPRQQLKHLWPNFLERETREKKRENCSPANPIPIQPRYAHALRIVADTNQPLTRAPTRTSCGEAGSEDSWLRLLSGSDRSKPTVHPNRQSM